MSKLLADLRGESYTSDKGRLSVAPAAFESMLREAAALREAMDASDTQALVFFAALCDLHKRQAEAVMDRRQAPPTTSEHRWLTPAEAAPMLAISTKTLARKWRSLPFCHPSLTNRGFRVSLKGLRAFMDGEAKESERHHGNR